MKKDAVKKPRRRVLARVAGTEEFDRELVAETFAPLTEEQREKWERARGKPGRPPRVRDAKVISVSVDRSLLERSDAVAHKMGISRAGLIARGLKAVLAVAGES